MVETKDIHDVWEFGLCLGLSQEKMDSIWTDKELKTDADRKMAVVDCWLTRKGIIATWRELIAAMEKQTGKQHCVVFDCFH